LKGDRSKPSTLPTRKRSTSSC